VAADGPLTIVLAGGDALTLPLSRPLPVAERVIAADGGIAHAETLGLEVDVLVGDLDSVAPDALAAARARGVRVDEHPRDKDATDLALALDLALDAAAERVLVIGGHGGRLDHLLGNVALLAADRYRSVSMSALLDRAIVTVVRGERTIGGQVGETVTLLATHGPASGVTTTGLDFPLTDDLLPAGSPLGLSNRFARPTATVRVAAGVLVVVQPDPDPKDRWP
jgi:thiamine pyrophosphokinase